MIRAAIAALGYSGFAGIVFGAYLDLAAAGFVFFGLLALRAAAIAVDRKQTVSPESVAAIAAAFDRAALAENASPGSKLGALSLLTRKLAKELQMSDEQAINSISSVLKEVGQ